MPKAFKVISGSKADFVRWEIGAAAAAGREPVPYKYIDEVATLVGASSPKAVTRISGYPHPTEDAAMEAVFEAVNTVSDRRGLPIERRAEIMEAMFSPRILPPKLGPSYRGPWARIVETNAVFPTDTGRLWYIVHLDHPLARTPEMAVEAQVGIEGPFTARARAVLFLERVLSDPEEYDGFLAGEDPERLDVVSRELPLNGNEWEVARGRELTGEA